MNGNGMNGDAAIGIGELGRATGTKVVTIRYYEKIGLLPPPPRTAGNYRTYTPEHVNRLGFIRRCRGLGFTLEQVRELLSLAGQKDRDCANVDRLAARHLQAVEQKIADLSRLADELHRVGNCCRGGRIADCRVIEALSFDAPLNEAPA